MYGSFSRQPNWGTNIFYKHKTIKPENQLHHYASTNQNHLRKAVCQQSNLEDVPSCDDCGLVFNNAHDLQRNIKRWCPESTFKRKRKNVEEEPSAKKSGYLKMRVATIVKSIQLFMLSKLKLGVSMETIGK